MTLVGSLLEGMLSYVVSCCTLSLMITSPSTTQWPPAFLLPDQQRDRQHNSPTLNPYPTPVPAILTSSTSPTFTSPSPTLPYHCYSTAHHPTSIQSQTPSLELQEALRLLSGSGIQLCLFYLWICCEHWELVVCLFPVMAGLIARLPARSGPALATPTRCLCQHSTTLLHCF